MLGTITVVGQGYVGLPLSIAAAESGYKVWGLDKDSKKVSIPFSRFGLLFGTPGLASRKISTYSPISSESLSQFDCIFIKSDRLIFLIGKRVSSKSSSNDQR